jgi:GNAT superfamily N-acetyltransferase
MAELVRATTDDLAAIAAIHVASWKAAYKGIVPDTILDGLAVEDRLRTWREWYTQTGVEIWLAIDAGEPVAFSRILPAPSSVEYPANTAELTHLYSLPEISGRGTSGALFSHMLSAARQKEYDALVLWVLEENRHARSFYERFGLRPDGGRQTRPEWLGEGVFEVRYRIDPLAL